MQVVFAGQSGSGGSWRRGGPTARRFFYTNRTERPESSRTRCCGMLAYGLSVSLACLGVMLTVFGSTGFFRSQRQNNAGVLFGLLALAAAFLLVILGLYWTNRARDSSAGGADNSTTKPNTALTASAGTNDDA